MSYTTLSYCSWKTVTLKQVIVRALLSTTNQYATVPTLPAVWQTIAQCWQQNVVARAASLSRSVQPCSCRNDTCKAWPQYACSREPQHWFSQRMHTGKSDTWTVFRQYAYAGGSADCSETWLNTGIVCSCGFLLLLPTVLRTLGACQPCLGLGTREEESMLGYEGCRQAFENTCYGKVLRASENSLHFSVRYGHTNRYHRCRTRQMHNTDH